MSQENIDPTMNESLHAGGAPFLYMQGDEPPGGTGGIKPTTTSTGTETDVDAYSEDLPDDGTITEPLPDDGGTVNADEPPGGTGGTSTS